MGDSANERCEEGEGCSARHRTQFLGQHCCQTAKRARLGARLTLNLRLGIWFYESGRVDLHQGLSLNKKWIPKVTDLWRVGLGAARVPKRRRLRG